MPLSTYAYTIPPEITFYEQDPESEMVTEYVQDVAFIRNYIPQELKELLSDDDIVYFVDLIYDYYESRGYLGDDVIDEEEAIEIDEEELLNYVVRNAQKDGVGKFEPDQIRFIVQGELEYCESINLFD